ncbi:uracil phosphoribosyltransferase [Chloropicon roscoffensis]|uniref:uracil phosphoribosyltransferase n=1 Tax=Chloropicon roscoffensis TaxID=1461544 RepID=A0AAX4PBL5_9CHLO
MQGRVCAGLGSRGRVGRTRAAPASSASRTARRARNVRVYAGPPKAPAGNPLGSSQMLVIVPPHPLVGHWIAVARNKYSPSAMFRNALAELGRILIYEAVREWLPVVEAQIETPLALADVSIVDSEKPIKVVPILRAGLVLLENAQTVLPASETYHLGLVRDEKTLLPTEYLNKLPDSFSPDDKILVSDPMLATGGTLAHALDLIVARGAKPENIRVICALAAPPGLSKISDKFAGLRIYAGIIDPELNDVGFIVPGVGDAGDRSFGT